MKYIVKSGYICVVTPNEWSHHDMAMAYIKYFNKYTELIGEYRLLILDKHDNHVIFRFEKFAYNNKIILLYLPAHTTYKLQLLNISIIGSQAEFYS